MQIRHALLVIAVLVLGIAAKQFLSPARKAEANAGVGLNVLQLQHDASTKNIPSQSTNDRTFVFGGD